MATIRPKGDAVDVVLYITEDPSQEGDIAALLDMYFEFFTHQTGWQRLETETNGTVIAATFHRVQPKTIKEILSRVEWGKRAPAALIKDTAQGLRHTDTWLPARVRKVAV